MIATVDAQSTACRRPESVQQAAAADTLVVTKTDLAPAAALVERRSRGSTRRRAVLEASFGDVEPDVLFGRPGHDRAAASRWRRRRPRARRRRARVRSSSTSELDWTAFGIWLTMLLQAAATDILRVKGLLERRRRRARSLLNGVQHVVHPPVHLDAWPDDDRRSRIVFIGRGFTGESLSASLAAFNAGRPG